jgi:hypothetical protein
MSVQVSNVISDVKNFSRNQNLSDDRVISSINTAIDLVSSHLGLPGHEMQYTFNYFEENPYIPLPIDFGEPISLRFNEDRLNRFNRFHYVLPEYIYPRINAVDFQTALWSYDFSSGKKQLIVLTKNSTAQILIDPFDNSANTWVASSDATNVVNDNITYKEGAGSLRFDINVNLSADNKATLTGIFPQGYDLRTMNDQGYFLVKVFIPNIINFSSITLSWGSNSSNYWTQTVMNQLDGSPFEVGWNTIGIPWYDASIIGIPDETNVKWFKFDFSYTNSYASTPGFRLDHLLVKKPDKMILSYYTTYKGKDVNGNYITSFSSPTDTFLFGDFDPALRQLISIETAVILNPQLLVENNSVSMLYNDFFSTYSRKYPKKRINNLFVDPTIARTSYD